MKNNTNIILILFLLFLNIKISYGADFKFETSTVDYFDDKKIVKATEGVKIFLEKNTTIKADKFIYEKEKSTVLIENNVVVEDPTNSLIIYAEEIIYNTSSEIIKSNLPSKVIYKNSYIFDLKNFVYDKKKLIVSSDSFSKLTDALGNKMSSEKFIFSINEKIIKTKNLIYKDNQNNEGKIENAMIDVKNNSIYGNDFELNFDNSLLGNKSNEPRIKARSAVIEDGNTKLTKGTFTSCKKRDDDKCPPWLINSEEVLHDKKKKTIYYKNAWLKVYDMPVLYFPKFFHPDPTVKRRSGFLVPSFTDSKSLGGAVTIPYYNVVSENKDFTVSPKIYFDKKAIIQTEYRQKNKSDEHIIDFSLLSNMQGENNSKTHFFSNSNFNLGLSAFDDSQLKINIEQTSHDTYLKTYNINSPIINNTSTLNSSLEISAYRDDMELELSTEILEDLSKTQNDRYEYVFPNFNFTKDLNLDSNIDGSLTFRSSGHRKLYDTNVHEDILVNDILYTSSPRLSGKGIMSDYKILIKNFNSDAKNSSDYKSNFDSNLMTQLIFDNKFPLIKKNKGQINYFTPKISLRYSPNKTRNLADEDRRIEYSNIFSLNRLSSENTVEGGESITAGFEYKKINNQNLEFLKFNIASSFRHERDLDVPLNSTLGKKNSDLFGNLFFKPNEIFNFDYNYAIDNSLDTVNYHHVKSDITINNFITGFEFLERSDEAANESFLKNSIGYKFDETNGIKYETRKNKLTDSTEYYSLIYEYKNDCLTAAIEYNKNYYTDDDLRPSEDIFFKLTIIPFGEARSPNLN